MASKMPSWDVEAMLPSIMGRNAVFSTDENTASATDVYQATASPNFVVDAVTAVTSTLANI